MLSFEIPKAQKVKICYDILLVNDVQELVNLRAADAKDKIIFVNYPIDPTVISTVDSYMIAAKSKTYFGIRYWSKRSKSFNYKIINHSFR
ncbi:hypothetical protein [Chryseobacterium indoltheticum]|uniref:hypothetical protein n=1 Tax=Chryseobacterium indoltheticum TaxID=254 RepID=UPI003F497355